MELSQGLPIILWPRHEYVKVYTLKRMDGAHTRDNIAERVQGIPAVHIDSGRTFIRRLVSHRIE